MAEKNCPIEVFILFSSRRTVGGRGVCVAQTCTDAQSACKTAHVGTTCPTPRSKRLRRCAFSDLCRSSAVCPPPTGGIGVRVPPASCVLVPKRDACAFLAQQEKPKTQPESHATVSYTAYNLAFLRFGCRSRYISRYEKLNLGFLPFVVATIVATAAIQAALPGSRRFLAAVFISFAFSTRRFSPPNRIGAQISKILS